jgi:hypothetical protein
VPQVWHAFGSLRQLQHAAASPSRASAFLLPKHAASALNEIGTASLARRSSGVACTGCEPNGPIVFSKFCVLKEAKKQVDKVPLLKS